MEGIKTGRTVWYWYGAGNIQAVTFLRWCKTKMGNGRENTNEIGVGAVVKSDWLYTIYGGTRTQNILRPYMGLYKTYKSAQNYRNEIKRPKVNKL